MANKQIALILETAAAVLGRALTESEADILTNAAGQKFGAAGLAVRTKAAQAERAEWAKVEAAKLAKAAEALAAEAKRKADAAAKAAKAAGTMPPDEAFGAIVATATAAVRADASAADGWKKAGEAIRARYASGAGDIRTVPEAQRAAVAALYETGAVAAAADKAVIVKYAIVPGLRADLQKAFGADDIPRSNSKEYKGGTDAQRADWDKRYTAKRDADKTANSYFSRLMGYAFPALPKPKAEASGAGDADKPEAPEAPARSDRERITDWLTECIKAVEKSDGMVGVDLVAAKSALVAARAMFTATGA